MSHTTEYTHRGRTSGFTLIEVVMVIVVLGIIGVSVGSLLSQGARSFETMKRARELNAEGVLAMERMARELRLIGCATSGNSCTAQSTDITAMTSGEIRFVTADSTGMGFRLNAGNIMMRRGSGAADPEDVLVGDASALSFDYFKKDGTTALATTEVWVIGINLTLASGSESMAFRTRVHPRALR